MYLQDNRKGNKQRARVGGGRNVVPPREKRSGMKKEEAYQKGTKKKTRKRLILGRSRQPLP